MNVTSQSKFTYNIFTTTYHTMDNNTTTEDQHIKETLGHIRMCFLPIIIIGTLTNILNLIVLSNKQMRGLSTSVYLLALSIADIGVMYFELFRVWFEWMDFIPHDSYFSKEYCRFANFTNGFFRDYSNWLIACLAVERLVMVASPLRSKVICTANNARWISLVLAAVIATGQLHYLILSTVRVDILYVCWENEDIPHASIIIAFFEFIFGYTVVIVVLVLNVILVMLLYHTHLSCLPESCRPKDGWLMQQYGRRHLTKTLLLISLVFLVCETPRVILSVVSKVAVRSFEFRVALNVSYVISGLNHASNFFVYISSSFRFRKICYNMIPLCDCRLTKNKKCDIILVPTDAWQCHYGAETDRSTE